MGRTLKLPPRNPEDMKLEGSTVRLPTSTWRELDEITRESPGYSRNDVLVEFIRWAIEGYRAGLRSSADVRHNKR